MSNGTDFECLVSTDASNKIMQFQLLATELQSYRVTDIQGYPVYVWVKFFVPDFNKLPYSPRSQGDNTQSLLQVL